MHKFLTIILFFLSFTAFSQVDFGNFTIQTHGDAVAEATIKKFIENMEANPIIYEKQLREIKEIKSVEADRDFVSSMADGVITLNKRLDDLPNMKEVIILHYLAKNGGMTALDKGNPHVANSNYTMTPRNEQSLKGQLEKGKPYAYVVLQLMKVSPL